MQISEIHGRFHVVKGKHVYGSFNSFSEAQSFQEELLADRVKFGDTPDEIQLNMSRFLTVEEVEQGLTLKPASSPGEFTHLGFDESVPKFDERMKLENDKGEQ